jgi:hypothetical protein
MEIFPVTNFYLVMDDDGQPTYHVSDGAGSDAVLWYNQDHWEAWFGLDNQPGTVVRLGEHADARDALAELNRHIALDELTARYQEAMRESQAELRRHIHP